MRLFLIKILVVAAFLTSASLRGQAADLSPEATALSSFQKCLQQGQELTEYGTCTKIFFADDLTQKQRKRLLAWFLSNPGLEVRACGEPQQRRAARKFPGKDISFLCARDKLASENEGEALFVFKKIEGLPKLLNLSR